MIRWGLLLLSIGLTLVFLSFTTIGSNSHLTANFLHSYSIDVPEFVRCIHISIVENKSDLKAVVMVYNGTDSYEVSTPYSTYTSSGKYEFFVVKEINTTDGKVVNTTDYYNVTLFLRVVKSYLVNDPKSILLQGTGLSVIGAVLSVKDLLQLLDKKVPRGS
ncbi:hypothetical protein [Stygiolobus caldivivus]|uniref:Uncharacterized protein n=1 Tax=Stygiolobus caldivivus TaxID=2824673 RepID=A0A8D5ZHC8_9CREN|nr:hypothetical protein [Stygiolobus caldivivus]BCU69584.1 hypothetical protein KN1_08810 [Stygiolobus caldivivus]